jgi:hypothetical protein
MSWPDHMGSHRRKESSKVPSSKLKPKKPTRLKPGKEEKQPKRPEFNNKNLNKRLKNRLKLT